MVAPIIVTALAFLHVISAIAWLGAAIFFASVIGPAVRTFTPAASLEFLVKVGPRMIRFLAGAATATILFGLALLYSAFGSDSALWPTNLAVGFTLGLIAYLDALFVVFPAFRKADRIAQGLAKNPQAGPPPPELTIHLNRGRTGAASVVVILVLATIFMVATGFPF